MLTLALLERDSNVRPLELFMDACVDIFNGAAPTKISVLVKTDTL